ncbi:MAG: L,D-transpeptidase [Chloroflexota bacterium]
MNATRFLSFSRRDFLRFSAYAVLGLFLPPSGSLSLLKQTGTTFRDLNPDQFGRVIYEQIDVYDSPSFEGKRVGQYWLDTVLPVTDVTVGDEEPAFNRVWYQVNGVEYVHSGGIQPVKTVLNLPSPNVPAEGTWGEVTVPYTDALKDKGAYEPPAYRFYYETIHWVLALEHDAFGAAWYRVLDDKFKTKNYYVPAEHMRLLSPAELTPISPHVDEKAKRIEVLTGRQVLIAYEEDQPVFMARTASGASMRDGNYKTKPGRYSITGKRAGRHMAAGDITASGYDLPGVPWICYITEDGIAIHGTYWHNNFGRPRSHGCVNVTPQAARWIYRWSYPIVPPEEQERFVTRGTPVDVIDDTEES